MTYQFPILSIHECVSNLKNYDVRVEEHDFKNPDGRKWQDIMRHLYELMTGNPLEYVIQRATFHSADEFEYTELHEDSAPLVIFTLSMQKALTFCGVDDFTVYDLLHPKTQRLVKICSSIVNFMLFKESRMDVFIRIKKHNEEFKEQHQRVLNTNSQLKKRINELKANRAEKESSISSIQNEIIELKEGIETKIKEKDAIQQQVAEKKTFITEKRADLDEIKVRKSKLNSEIDQISRKIIRSPERMKADEEKARSNLERMKQNLDFKRQNLMEKQNLLQGVQEACEEREKAIKMLHDMQVLINKESDIAREIQTLHDKNQEQRDTERELSAKRDQLKLQVANRQEKQSKLMLQHQQKKRLMQDNLQKIEEEKNSLLQQKSKEDRQTHMLIQEEQSCLQKVKRKKDEFEEETKKVYTKYTQILQSLEKYHASLGTNWEGVRNVLSSE